MLAAYWQYDISLWAVFFLILMVLVIPMEVGFRLGRRKQRLHPDAGGAARNDVTLPSMLALLGLMLAFTYSFSMSRADLRKKAFITEVNAMSTAFMRADLAAEPARTELRQRLLDYARSRLVTPGTITAATETEGAAIAVVYAAAIGFFVTRKLSLKAMPGVLFRAAVTAAMVGALIAFADADAAARPGSVVRLPSSATTAPRSPRERSAASSSPARTCSRATGESPTRPPRSSPRTAFSKPATWAIGTKTESFLSVAVPKI